VTLKYIPAFVLLLLILIALFDQGGGHGGVRPS
jgi:hypothetical protein